ncbi:MAG TPA: peptidase U32 [Eggerthellaceae bacterium]|nr:peptidase U32 [Eggerthellaceae bacterium]
MTARPELLAPAGGWSQLKAAIRFGADAVYLAAESFGMRARASNFPLNELGTAVAYAHERGVAVHVAANTLMDARDIEALPAFFETVRESGADALIVADLGAFSLARKHAPGVQLHVSTQASVMNAESARMWHELGASRVVCAREMSVADIALMRQNVPEGLQIEAFVHGAMCVAYSGRCLLSSAMTGRTANKGACAQSCRWSYALVEEQRPGEYFDISEDARGTYILNAQDLNMVSHLDDLARAGVDSFKIEGRNKQAFYVATVVGAYRSVLDGGDAEAAERELRTISHRPYGTGFYYGRAEQTPERDGYVREYLHVGTVEDCVERDDGTWRVTALCHNRFERGDVLEIVSPGSVGRMVHVRNLARLAPNDGGLPFVERGDLPLQTVRSLSVEQPELVANRSKEHYLFDSDVPLCAGDYLRRKAG